MTDTAIQLTPKQPKSRKRKFAKWLTIFAVLSIMLGAGGYAASQMLIGPSEGVIVNAVPEFRSRAVPAVEYEQYEGTYLTFAYPNTYKVQPANKDNPNGLETHTLIASGLMSKIVTVTASRLPSGRLEDDASYYMRTLNPQTYKITPQTIQGEKVMVALNAKDSQQSAFWAHGGKLLTFTISSISINSEATMQEYQKMLESVRWRP